MAQIQEYLPEAEGAGPAGNLSPNLGAIGQLGQGVENLGKGLKDVSDVLYKRQEQKEISQSYSLAAGAHAEQMAGLDKDIQDGTIDPDKAKQKWQGFVEKNADQFETAGGKNFYNRLTARFGANLLEHAALGKVHVDGAAAVEEHQQAVSASANAVINNPSSFETAVEAARLKSLEQVRTGGLSQINADKLALKDNNLFAMNAIQGWAQLDPAVAKKYLDEGKYDKFLQGDAKAEMYGRVHSAAMAKEADKAKLDRDQRDADEANDQKIGNDFVHKLVNHQLTGSMADASGITDYKTKMYWVKAAESDAKERSEGDPAVAHRLFQKIFTGELNDVNQLAPYAAKGQLSPNQMQSLSSWMDKSPDGKIANERRKSLYSLMTANFVEAKDPRTQTRDPMGPMDMQKAVQALQAKEAEYRVLKKPVNSLYDVNSPDYFGKQIDQFKPTPAEKMERYNQAMGFGDMTSTGGASALNKPPPTTGAPAPAAPTTPPPPLSAKAAAPGGGVHATDEMKKRPDETWPEFVRRTDPHNKKKAQSDGR